MAFLPDVKATRDWYARLPDVFRDLDNGDLAVFLRVLGDYVGGLRLLVQVFEGTGLTHTVTVPGPPEASLTVEPDGDLTVFAATLDTDTGGLRVPLDDPITVVDPGDAEVLLVASANWLLTDVESIPETWVEWLAQVLSVPLEGIPEDRWREWIADPASRAPGSIPAIALAASFHATGVTVEKTGLWEVTVTRTGLVTSLPELQAAMAAQEPAGVEIVLG